MQLPIRKFLAKKKLGSQAEEDVKSSGLLQLPGATEKVISVTVKRVLFFLSFQF